MNRDWERATRSGDVESVRVLLESGADIDSLDRHNQTALMHAAHRGDVRMVEYLVQHGANLDHAAKYGFTALILAVVGNHPQVVGALLRAGADPTKQASQSSRIHAGEAALDLARRWNRAEIVALLENPAAN